MSRKLFGAGAIAATAMSAAAVALPSSAAAYCVDDQGNPCHAPATVQHVGRFAGTKGTLLPVYGTPARKGKPIRYVPAGARALITCQARGQKVTGVYGTGRLWDHLLKGGYVSDTMVYTGRDGRVAKAC